MTLKATIGVSIVAFGLCLAVRDASAAVFQPASQADANGVGFDASGYGGVYNTETQVSRNVVAPYGLYAVIGGSFEAVTITGLGNGRPITCSFQAYGLTTQVLTTTASTTSSSTFFTMTLTLSSSALGNLNGLFVYGTICSLPPVNAQGERAQLFWASAPTGSIGIQAAGWVPAGPNDTGWIRSNGAYFMYNSDSANARFATAALAEPQQLGAGSRTVTFYGRRPAGTVTYVCQMNLRNLATGETFSASVTNTDPVNTNFAMNASVNLPAAGLYDVGLLCKLPPLARIYGARIL